MSAKASLQQLSLSLHYVAHELYFGLLDLHLTVEAKIDPYVLFLVI